jgi:hypothetical protein
VPRDFLGLIEAPGACSRAVQRHRDDEVRAVHHVAAVALEERRQRRGQ